MRLGIIGAGGIAQKMAEALANKPHGCECYAVASRSLEKAEAFAKQFYINQGVWILRRTGQRSCGGYRLYRHPSLSSLSSCPFGS